MLCCSNDFTLTGAFKPKKNVEINADFIDGVAGSLLALVPMGTASTDAGSKSVLAGIAAVNDILVEGAAERGNALPPVMPITIALKSVCIQTL
jgi:hypothetical protein